ncbi:MAG: gliding motility protein GldN [Bacteroidetes bacterium]|nr:gliding motility protein GldN [Bacteroidota bacterium]
MKKLISSILLFFVLGSIFDSAAYAQVKKPVAKKPQPAAAKKKPAATKTNTAPVQVADAVVAAPPPAADTTKPVPSPVQFKDPFAFDSIKVSLRTDASVERNLVKTRTPLAYENIREDDAWYRHKVWREIDIREKMNLPFRYKAEDDNGNQRFINILFRTIKNGGVTAFDANVDDRFTTPMPIAKVGELITGKCDSVQVIDWAKDPDGTKGVFKDSLVCRDFNPDDIIKYRIKEEWVFDKESSRMFVRILGIAPMRTYLDESGNLLGESPLFWIYYPDLRGILAKYDVYNTKNFGGRMSWEELFESRYFDSKIVKSTIDNPYDLFIKQYIKDNILQLLEGENIKNKIFNFEQDLWSY